MEVGLSTLFLVDSWHPLRLKKTTPPTAIYLQHKFKVLKISHKAGAEISSDASAKISMGLSTL